MKHLLSITLLGAGLILAGTLLSSSKEATPLFDFPVACIIGQDCFLQNLVDMDATSGIIQDSLCGADSYDNHKGTDIRVRTLKDLEDGIDILAVADGIVVGLRDGEADELVTPKTLKQARQGRECGNGVAIAHANGWRTQYCHMQKGSLTVVNGQKIKRGMPLGKMGYSDLSTFPHLHLSVFKNGNIVDPLFGQTRSAHSCQNTNVRAGLFYPEKTKALINSRDDIMAIGLSDAPLKADALIRGNAPPPPSSSSETIVAWAWLINPQKGDQVRIKIEKDNQVFSDVTTKPLEKRQVQYLHFAGRKRTPKPGTYKVSVFQIRNGQIFQQKIERFEVH